MLDYNSLAQNISKVNLQYTTSGNLVVFPDNFLETARLAVRALFWHAPTNLPTLVKCASRGWLYWQPCAWRPVDQDFIESKLYHWFDTTVKTVRLKNSRRVYPVTATERLIRETRKALAALTLINLPEPPCLLATQVNKNFSLLNPESLVAFANGIWDPISQRLLPPTPAYFNKTTSPVSYTFPAPPPKTWLNFLSQTFANNTDQIATLQEAFGYCLSAALRWEHIFLLIGPPLSGKSTIAEVLTSLVGSETTAELNLNLMQNDMFYLSYLQGRNLGIARDFRIDESTRKGQNVISHLLSIATDEPVPIRVMHQGTNSDRLHIRFFLNANPGEFRLSDHSSALLRRLIPLETKASVKSGDEDRDLINKLRLELPSIALWALEGLDRALIKNRVVIPASSKKLLAELQSDFGNPVELFANENLEVVPNITTIWSEIYNFYCKWCVEEEITPLSRRVFRDKLADHYRDNPSIKGLHRSERDFTRASDSRRSRIVHNLALRPEVKPSL